MGRRADGPRAPAAADAAPAADVPWIATPAAAESEVASSAADSDRTAAAAATDVVVAAAEAAATASAVAIDAEGAELRSLRAQVDALEAEGRRRDAAHATEVEKLREALRDEREKAETRLQNLQLRLYISDTRNATLEEALVAHVQTVVPLKKVEWPVGTLAEQKAADERVGAGVGGESRRSRLFEQLGEDGTG